MKWKRAVMASTAALMVAPASSLRGGMESRISMHVIAKGLQRPRTNLLVCFASIHQPHGVLLEILTKICWILFAQMAEHASSM
jgi:hypothetical protein